MGMSKLDKIEFVLKGKGPWISRMAVPGGWLYMNFERTWAEFVPDPDHVPASKQLQTPSVPLTMRDSSWDGR